MNERISWVKKGFGENTPLLVQWDGKYAICNHLAKLAPMSLAQCRTNPTPSATNNKKDPAWQAYRYPKLKRPSGHVAGRAFLRGCYPVCRFSSGVIQQKRVFIISLKPEKDLGEDRLGKRGLFPKIPMR